MWRPRNSLWSLQLLCLLLLLFIDAVEVELVDPDKLFCQPIALSNTKLASEPVIEEHRPLRVNGAVG